jgi:hypothetical protein
VGSNLTGVGLGITTGDGLSARSESENRCPKQ